MSTPARLALGISADGPSPELQRLQRGELSLEEYLDSRVERALAQVRPLISASAVNEVRRLLREELLTDPVLQSYTEQATGLRAEEPPQR